MNRIEEILPRITEFLRDELARERLSPVAERTRQFYVGRIEAVLQQEADQFRGDTSGCSGDQSTNIRPTDTTSPSGLRTASGPSLQTRSTNLNEEQRENRALPASCDGSAVDTHKTTQQLNGPIYHNETVQPASSESENESGTDYVGYEEYIGEATDLYDHICSLPPTVGGSLDSRKQPRNSRRHVSRSTSDSQYSRSGTLYHKGTLTMNKWYCIISDSSLICYNRGKETKPLLSVDLKGYEAVCTECEDKQVYHELRLTCPGRGSYWFYSRDLEYLRDWVKDLNLAATQLSPACAASPPLPDRPADIFPRRKSSSESGHKSLSSDNISINSGSADKTPHTTKLEKKSSNTDESKKAGFMMKTLKNTFGKKKGNKIKHAANDMTIYSDPDVMIAGHLYVSCNSGGAGESCARKWMHRYCVIKCGRLEIYKNECEDRMEFFFPLPGAQICLPDPDINRHFVFKLCQKENIIYLDTCEMAEHGRWLNILIKETGFANRIAESGKQSRAQDDVNGSVKKSYDGGIVLYDEIRQYNDYAPDDKPPPIPELPDSYSVLNEFTRVFFATDEKLKDLTDAGGYLEPDEFKLIPSKVVRTDLAPDAYMNMSEQIHLEGSKKMKEVHVQVSAPHGKQNSDSKEKHTKPVCDVTSEFDRLNSSGKVKPTTNSCSTDIEHSSILTEGSSGGEVTACVKSDFVKERKKLFEGK